MILDTTEHGSGEETIVFLHSLALDSSIWRDVVPEVAKTAHTLTVDLRGHGQSDPDTGFTVEDMADDVAETMRACGFESATVVGLSLGGCVAQAVAFRHPSMVHRLVLAGTTAWYGEDAPAAWRGRAEKALNQGLESLSEFQLERWFGDEFRLANPSICADLLDRFKANDLESYAATCDALGTYDGRGRVESIEVPTEIIVGEQDGATPPSVAYDLGQRIPGAAVTVLPNAKHLTALERPDAFIAGIARVLAR